ncbi:serine/threonine-protein kinase, partial [bacterium]|nr:serine/threonine-protein kinase [bacterium]
MRFNSPEEWEKLWKTFHELREAPTLQRESHLKILHDSDPEFSRYLEELLHSEEYAGEQLEELVAEQLSQLTREQEEPQIESGSVLAGRFRIVRHLGKGGMGNVYEALDQELGVPVALKLMRSDIGTDAAPERFHREIANARKITHPNACRIFDLFRHDDLLFLTMELLEGETLHQRIKREGRFSPATALSILKQIADALLAIHQAGIVHRDLKSGNIILVPSGNGFRAVVTDFGLAVADSAKDSEPVTVTGQVLGTPQFMAPEQLTRGIVSSRTDIYALGLVTYQLITGKLPYEGEPSLTIAAMRISEDSPSPKKYVPDLPRNWERAILRCLDRDPGKRFRTVTEFLNALEADSLNNILPDFVLRNPIRSLLATALLIVIFAVVWFARSTFSSKGRSDAVVVKRLWKGSTGLPPGIVSTDGRILIDVDWQTADVLAIDLQSGKKRRVTQSNIWFLPHEFTPHPGMTCLSPDGKKVAYSVQHVWDPGCDLRVSDIDGSSLRNLYSSKTACANPVDWSRDMQKLLVRLIGTNENHIALASINKTDLRILKSLESGNVRKMNFSPDGEQILYDFPQQKGSTNHDLFLLSIKDGTDRPLIQHKAHDYVLGWAPDGRSVLFASDRSGTYDAWSLPLQNSKENTSPSIVRKDIGQVYPLKITKDGSLFYAHLMSSFDVFTGSLSARAGQPVKISSGFPGSNGGPEFAPDGKYLIFQTAKNPFEKRWNFAPPAQLALLSLDSNEEKRFSHGLQMVGLFTRWSNGDWILIYGKDEQTGAGLYRVNTITGETLKVVDDPPNNWVRAYDWAGD